AKTLCYPSNRRELNLVERFANPSVQKSVAADLALADGYDDQIRDLELYLTRTAKVDDPQAFHRLRTIPGVGPVLALIFLYEIHDVTRFPEAGNFLSYARLVRCAHESGGEGGGARGGPGRGAPPWGGGGGGGRPWGWGRPAPRAGRG